MLIDPDNAHVVLNIVYDGSPCAGKTESVRALGRLLGSEVVTPEEKEGRTQYFDWLGYQGGRCLNHPLHCRAIGVPGQPELSARREAILSTADAVIFVADSEEAGFAASLERFRDLETRLAASDQRIPVLVQLNKRDLPDALPIAEMCERLGPTSYWRTIETVATEGKGIREAFVLVIGEALRALRSSGSIYRRDLDQYDTQEMGLPNPEQLYEMLFSLPRG